MTFFNTICLIILLLVIVDLSLTSFSITKLCEDIKMKKSPASKIIFATSLIIILISILYTIFSALTTQT